MALFNSREIINQYSPKSNTITYLMNMTEFHQYTGLVPDEQINFYVIRTPADWLTVEDQPRTGITVMCQGNGTTSMLRALIRKAIFVVTTDALHEEYLVSLESIQVAGTSIRTLQVQDHDTLDFVIQSTINGYSLSQMLEVLNFKNYLISIGIRVEKLVDTAIPLVSNGNGASQPTTEVAANGTPPPQQQVTTQSPIPLSSTPSESERQVNSSQQPLENFSSLGQTSSDQRWAEMVLNDEENLDLVNQVMSQEEDTPTNILVDQPDNLNRLLEMRVTSGERETPVLEAVCGFNTNPSPDVNMQSVSCNDDSNPPTNMDAQAETQEQENDSDSSSSSSTGSDDKDSSSSSSGASSSNFSIDPVSDIVKVPKDEFDVARWRIQSIFGEMTPFELSFEVESDDEDILCEGAASSIKRDIFKNAALGSVTKVQRTEVSTSGKRKHYGVVRRGQCSKAAKIVMSNVKLERDYGMDNRARSAFKNFSSSMVEMMDVYVQTGAHRTITKIDKILINSVKWYSRVILVIPCGMDALAKIWDKVLPGNVSMVCEETKTKMEACMWSLDPSGSRFKSQDSAAERMAFTSEMRIIADHYSTPSAAVTGPFYLTQKDMWTRGILLTFCARG
ncbi:protein P7 [Raspberry latent virus]|uniref:protein P7 n=1 Tax=Raspberry latent virus TaxID=907191 RepID=UPI0001E6901E|nr:protein P7 [Raspberry latent virus]ADO27693.1 protein P7 [Raspberry latent virus]